MGGWTTGWMDWWVGGWVNPTCLDKEGKEFGLREGGHGCIGRGGGGGGGRGGGAFSTEDHGVGRG